MYDSVGLEQRVSKLLEESKISEHDPAHMKRVHLYQRKINRGEGNLVDDEIMHANSWLHDVGHISYNSEDPTSFDKHPERSVEIAKKILPEVGFPEEKLELVLKAIRWHDDTKPWGTHQKFDEPEVLILQDADNLEAIGEIGVKRLIAYGNTVNMPYFIPELSWDDPEAKSKSILHNIYAHLNIYNLLNTKTAKEIAKPMLKHMYDFIKQEIIKFYSAKDEHEIADKIPPFPIKELFADKIN